MTISDLHILIFMNFIIESNWIIDLSIVCFVWLEVRHNMRITRLANELPHIEILACCMSPISILL